MFFLTFAGSKVIVLGEKSHVYVPGSVQCSETFFVAPSLMVTYTVLL